MIPHDYKKGILMQYVYRQFHDWRVRLYGLLAERLSAADLGYLRSLAGDLRQTAQRIEQTIGETERST
jgi:hypothetical protein